MDKRWAAAIKVKIEQCKYWFSDDMERKAVNDMFVVLSDIWLDDEETMVKVKEVLEGYEAVEVVPSLFIFMGSFCSSLCNLSFHSFASLRSQFGNLGKMIAEYPRLLEQSWFLFIPSIDDAGPSSVLPRCALPKYLTEELQKEIPNALFMSNPCRIKYYSQEIVIFRRDLLYRMRRSCLIPPSSAETSDPFAHGEYMEKLEVIKNKGIKINPDKVYLEVVGGQKKGKVYGLRSASQMYYKSDPASQLTASSSTPSMISQLSSQVEELKKMAEENHYKVEESQKIAAESLKYAKEFVENHEIEKATWKKEKLAMQKTL